MNDRGRIRREKCSMNTLRKECERKNIKRRMRKEEC
jgi:hypothetical protein